MLTNRINMRSHTEILLNPFQSFCQSKNNLRESLFIEGAIIFYLEKFSTFSWRVLKQVS